jgi:hypothetical protein
MPLPFALHLMSALSLGQIDPMTLPNRCPPSQIFANDDDFGWAGYAKAHPGADRDAFFWRHMFNEDVRHAPMKSIMALQRQTDYYARAAELQATAEKVIAEEKDPRQKQISNENYAMVLLYLGEFQKLIAYFGPASPHFARDFATDGGVHFALSQAYWRLGKYPEAQQFGHTAVKYSDELDTRWGVMLADLAVYGNDLTAKHDKKLYTTEFIDQIFKEKDWSKIPFEDVTDAMGVQAYGGAGSVSWADLDGDGWDELIKEEKFFPFEILKNDHGKLTAIPQEKLGYQSCTTLGLTGPADIDNDGKPDLYRHCCNLDGAGPAVMLRNLGELTFEDITKVSGLDFKGAGTIAAWADYDNDGFIDLIVGDTQRPARLYHNTGHGTFVETTEKAGVHTPSMAEGSFGAVGMTWADFNDDGYPDLFIQGWGWKRYFQNNKDGTFSNNTAKAGFNEDTFIKGYSTHVGDFDGDGKIDIYVGQYVVTSGRFGFSPTCTCSNLLRKEGYLDREWKAASTIYRNNGDGTFTDMVATTHLVPYGTMSANSADWDNDGDLDLLEGSGGPFIQQAEPFLFYENEGNFKFTLRTPFHDPKLWGKGHGTAFGDYDHDGNLDLYLVNGGSTLGDVFKGMLLHNKGNGNHWLEVAFKAGPETNRSAIGAKVKVTAGGRTWVQELSSGGRFGDTNTLRLHFGLAKNTLIDRIEVRWPNKKLDTTVLTKVGVDQAIEIDEVTGTQKQLWTAPHGDAPKVH